MTNIRVEGTEDVDLRGVNALFTFQHDQKLKFFSFCFWTFHNAIICFLVAVSILDSDQILTDGHFDFDESSLFLLQLGKYHNIS